MLQQPKGDDYVLATGELNSVRSLVEIAFNKVNKTILWEGEGLNEVGREANTNIVRVKISKEFYRPSEVELLLGDFSKAKAILDWEPTTTFEELVNDMMDAALARN